MKNYITGNDMLLHSSKVQNWKGESHATTTGCSMINCTLHPPVIRELYETFNAFLPSIKCHLGYCGIFMLVSFIKSNFLVVLFLSTIGLGYFDS